MSVPEVRHLQLVQGHFRPSGTLLRQFLTRAASYRTRLTFPSAATDDTITWRSIGLDYDGAPRFNDWNSVLTRMHYVLALPEEHFKKTSQNFQLRMQALEKVKRNKIRFSKMGSRESTLDAQETASYPKWE